ncbi:facilitated trehalose transporter Tret1-like isoform X3 [Homalodisca vitripennis]|uniref:facilitated trehalose transporter Tret1-like isoform X3 n=1 Tax=Homalodisca vitripennis TaxID=197043 RepID=UPI001EECC42F|nr:facilitated trehalose transporter Tret1-like isoform X3 [Homalodisca vitripennis]
MAGFLPDKFKGSTDRAPGQPRVKDIYPQVNHSILYGTHACNPDWYHIAYFAILLPQYVAVCCIIAPCIAHMLLIQAGINMAYSAIHQPQIVSDYTSYIAHMLVIQAGINMAYSEIHQPQLMDDNSTFRIDKDQASWIASLMAIATPVGALVCGPFMDLLGRRLFSVIATVPIILSWFILVLMPNSVWLLYVARVLAGFGGGLTTVSIVYISEISNAAWRPMLLCLNSVFVSLGILLTNILGVCLPWRVVALSAGCLTLTSAAAILAYNPESPYWLLTFSPSEKNFEQAKKSLRFLYPNQQMFAMEWDRLVTLSQEKRDKDPGQSESDGLIGKVKQSTSAFLQRSSLLPLALLMTIFLFQQLSGTYPIIFYAVQVFQSIGGHFGGGLDEDSATVLLGIIRFAMSLLTAGLSRMYGRRPLLIVSGVGMTISSFAAAIYLQKSSVFNNVFNKNQIVLNHTSLENLTYASVNVTNSNSSAPILGDPNVDNMANLIGLICILVFVSMSSLGFLIIPWTLIGEILPLSVRGMGGGLLVSFAYVLMFGVVKIFPFMLDVLHISGCFYFFSFTSLINVLIVYFFLPETLGKSFEEIAKFFVRPR